MFYVSSPVALGLESQGNLAHCVWKYSVECPKLSTRLSKGHLDCGRTASSGHSPGAALKLWDMLIPSAFYCISGLCLELAKVFDLLTENCIRSELKNVFKQSHSCTTDWGSVFVCFS